MSGNAQEKEARLKAAAERALAEARARKAAEGEGPALPTEFGGRDEIGRAHV